MSPPQNPKRRRGFALWWSSQSNEAKAAYIVGLVTLLAAVIGTPIITHALGSGGGNSNPPSASRTTPPVLTSPTASGSTAPTPKPISSTPSSASQYLSDFSPVSDSGSLYTGGAEVNGKFYSKSVILYLNPGPASVAYNLGRQWRSLETTVGLRDDSADNQKFQFQAFADGHLIYNHEFALGQSQQIALDVGGTLRLELVVTIASDYVGPAYAIWGNAALTD